MLNNEVERIQLRRQTFIHYKLVSYGKQSLPHSSGEIAFDVVLGKLEVLYIHDWRHRNSVILHGLAIDCKAGSLSCVYRLITVRF